MDITEYWATLVSIIIGLGIADLLVNLQRLIHERNRVEWHALPLVWALIALLWLFNYWWAVSANIDGSRDATVVGHFVLLAIPPILLFLMSASVLPRSMPQEGRLDMRVEWASTRTVFLTLFALNQVAAWVVVILARGGLVWDTASTTRTGTLVLLLLALRFKSRNFEWFVVACILLLAVARLSTQAVG
jgi:hypothetical protein